MDVRTKSKNYESSILFMQQEHAQTLKALHDEISKLQQRCSELTFQVAMNSTYTSQEDAYKEKADGFESDLKSYKKMVSDLKGDLETKDKRSKFLEEQLKAQERKYKSELRGKDQTIAGLHNELESKATTITTLTMKYRELKKGVRASREKSARARSATQPESAPSPREQAGLSPVPPTPAPPKEGAPKQRHHRRSVGNALSQATVRNRPPSSRILEDRPGSGNSSDSISIPDPTPFLRLASSEKEPKPSVRRERAVIPPINSSVAENAGIAAMPVLLPASADSDKFIKGSCHRGERVSSSSPDYEVETLAVDQVKGRRHTLRRAREYNTSSDC